MFLKTCYVFNIAFAPAFLRKFRLVLGQCIEQYSSILFCILQDYCIVQSVYYGGVI